jgi:hypothetical protein
LILPVTANRHQHSSKPEEVAPTAEEFIITTNINNNNIIIMITITLFSIVASQSCSWPPHITDGLK